MHPPTCRFRARRRGLPGSINRRETTVLPHWSTATPPPTTHPLPHRNNRPRHAAPTTRLPLTTINRRRTPRRATRRQQTARTIPTPAPDSPPIPTALPARL